MTAIMLATTTGTVFAATEYSSPAEIVAQPTGRTVESIISEKVEAGKTLGSIAYEAGKLDEFRAEMLELREANIEAGTGRGFCGAICDEDYGANMGYGQRRAQGRGQDGGQGFGRNMNNDNCIYQ